MVQLGRLSAGHTERPLTARRQAAAAAAGAAADSLVHGESVLLLPSIATEAERAALVAAGLAAAHRQREATRAPLARRLADKMVRVPTAVAAASVAEADGVHLADEAAETIDAVLPHVAELLAHPSAPMDGGHSALAAREFDRFSTEAAARTLVRVRA